MESKELSNQIKFVQHVCDSPKKHVRLCSGIMRYQVVCPLTFPEKTIIVVTDLDMFENFIFSHKLMTERER